MRKPSAMELGRGCSIGDEGAVIQLRMGIRNPEIDVCAMILEWGFPPRNAQTKAVANRGMDLSDGSYLVGVEPGSYPVVDEPSE